VPNQIVRRYQELVILRENAEDPSDAEWGDFLRVLAAGDGVWNVRVLVVTDGGSPSGEQRQRLKTVLGDSNVRAAIVTDSVKTRFVVSSIAFITSRIKSFSKREIDAAYEYLGLDVTQRRLADRVLAELTEATCTPAGPTASQSLSRGNSW
jgi:hypothetical protein